MRPLPPGSDGALREAKRIRGILRFARDPQAQRLGVAALVLFGLAASLSLIAHK